LSFFFGHPPPPPPTHILLLDECLTFLCALFKAVVDLLEHGLAASLKHGQHGALEGVFVGRLDGPLQGIGRRSANSVRYVL